MAGEDKRVPSDNEPLAQFVESLDQMRERKDWSPDVAFILLGLLYEAIGEELDEFEEEHDLPCVYDAAISMVEQATEEVMAAAIKEPGILEEDVLPHYRKTAETKH